MTILQGILPDYNEGLCPSNSLGFNALRTKA